TMLKPMRLTALRRSVISVSMRRNSTEFAMRKSRAASAGSELKMRTISSVVVSGDCNARWTRSTASGNDGSSRRSSRKSCARRSTKLKPAAWAALDITLLWLRLYSGGGHYRSLPRYVEVRMTGIETPVPYPLHGLVLAGGRGTRLGSGGRDKGLLDYHGEPQARWAMALLAPFCARVYVSLRAEQAGAEQYAALATVIDSASFGPASGLAAAFALAPDAAWLVL